MKDYLVKDFKCITAPTLSIELNRLAQEGWVLKFVVESCYHYFERDDCKADTKVEKIVKAKGKKTKK